ncbi:hypothetical protein SDC9_80864 [bioreactor metagenome]|uniref:Uncharacterized protein n=1 Tax=bioreactor metagenome TaxID=1076179 RepID=A0A644Z0L9_9ZZZZ
MHIHVAPAGVVQGRRMAERGAGAEPDHPCPAGGDQSVQEVAHLSGPDQHVDIGADASLLGERRIDRVALDVQQVRTGQLGHPLDGRVTELDDGRQRRLRVQVGHGGSLSAAGQPSAASVRVGPPARPGVGCPHARRVTPASCGPPGGDPGRFDDRARAGLHHLPDAARIAFRRAPGRAGAGLVPLPGTDRRCTDHPDARSAARPRGSVDRRGSRAPGGRGPHPRESGGRQRPGPGDLGGRDPTRRPAPADHPGRHPDLHHRPDRSTVDAARGRVRRSGVRRRRGVRGPRGHW